MSKVSERVDFRVEVRPRSKGDFGGLRTNIFGEHTPDEARRACEDIAQQIRRHVDGLPSSGDRGVDVVWGVESKCGHCGARWTEDSSDYNGGCCAQDIAEEEARNPGVASG
jgi:hypothetical protein